MKTIKQHSFLVISIYILLIELCNSAPAPGDDAVRKNLLLHAKRAQDAGKCDHLITQKEISEIAAFKPAAQKIIDFILNGSFKGEAYKELKQFVEKFPFRPSGHQNLENAIDYLMNVMKTRGLESIRSEAVRVPMWNGPKSKLSLVKPYEREFKILAIQNTTNPLNSEITANVLVVRSFEDLDRQKDEAQGKIVIFNHGFLGYGRLNTYKAHGASHAAQFGAVAALISSTAYPSFDSASATQVNYWPNVTKIPSAIIPMDDAAKLYELQEAHKEIVAHLHMEDFNEATSPSKNAIGEIGGHLKKEYVALVAHTDCANEHGGTSDATGIFMSVMALAAIKSLKLAPHRTMLSILLTGNEEGLWGADSYVQKHRNTFSTYSAVMQSDGGAFQALGIDFAGTERAGCLIREILKLCEPLLATAFSRFPVVSTDILRFTADGIPGLSLNTEDKVRLQKRHKQEADNISAIDSDELDTDVAVWSIVSFVIADLQAKLPRS